MFEQMLPPSKFSLVSIECVIQFHNVESFFYISMSILFSIESMHTWNKKDFPFDPIHQDSNQTNPTNFLNNARLS